MFLIVVDAHSKWPEVIPMVSTVWRRHIDQLRQSAITVNPNTDDPATQPNPAVFPATPLSTYNRVPLIPTCGCSKEAVTPDQDISATPGHPSSNQCKDITSTPETPCRPYHLRLRRSLERLDLRLFLFCFVSLLFVFSGEGMPCRHVLTSGLVNISCARIPCI